MTYVLFGAGTIGRVVARELKDVACFADNNEKKWHTDIDGIPILPPADAILQYPDATWIATALRTPFRAELQAQIDSMGVKSISTWEFMVRRYEQPSAQVLNELISLSADDETKHMLWDQCDFRLNFDLSKQRPMWDIKDVYFPEFIAHDLNELFIDCGAADGDTVKEVLKRWRNPTIISIEPDPKNYDAFQGNHFSPNVSIKWGAVSDFAGDMRFCASGDQTSHLAGANERIPTHNGFKVPVFRLDDLLKDKKPTYIKMDIEGAEPEALWGARETLKKHSPVLAICAYHQSSHLWDIPLLIHAINPDYKLYLRRYLEATWELVWYAVPPERVK